MLEKQKYWLGGYGWLASFQFVTLQTAWVRELQCEIQWSSHKPNRPNLASSKSKHFRGLKSFRGPFSCQACRSPQFSKLSRDLPILFKILFFRFLLFLKKWTDKDFICLLLWLNFCFLLRFWSVLVNNAVAFIRRKILHIVPGWNIQHNLLRISLKESL